MSAERADQQISGTEARLSTLAELMADIRMMEDTVLYYQNRILRKQIAFAEIVAGHEMRTPQISTEKFQPAEPERRRRKPIIAAIRSVLNGTPLSRGEIHAMIREQVQEKISRSSLNHALFYLESRSEIEKLGARGNFKFKSADAPRTPSGPRSQHFAGHEHSDDPGRPLCNSLAADGDRPRSEGMASNRIPPLTS